jgi:hypothetical protein
MKVRTYTAGIGVAALALSGLALGAVTPAVADPSFTPSATLPAAGGDVVGVGSDTIEFVVQDLADAWNAAGPPAYKVASWNATGSSTITLRSGTAAVTRPNGSGSGKATLFGAGNNPNVSFARSSSSLNTTEAAALTQFPFAVDGLKLAVSGATPSNAPASITAAQMVKIYDGTYKTWGDIPGYAGPAPLAFIHPLTPQGGSGTRSFFDNELKAANGGVAVNYAAVTGAYPGVVQVQEHDATPIKNDPNAVAPFSTARQTQLATPGDIHLEGGYRARRAVYDVVRNADAGTTWVDDLFGTAGFWCSAAGRTVISAAGFEPLDTVTSGVGQCGKPLTAPPSNLNVFGATVSTTSLAASSPSLHTVDLDATVSSSAGVVQFYDGANQVGTDVPVTTGHAVAHLTGITGGSHTFVAKFLANDTTAVTDSQGSKSVSVVSNSTTTAAVVAHTYGHASSATVTVSAEGTPATGNVTVKLGATVIGTKALTAGAASFALPSNLPAGAKSLTATYAGNATTGASEVVKPFTIGKSAVVVSETFRAKVKRGKRAVGSVVVALSPGSALKPTGTVVIKKGSKIVGKGTLVGGVLKIKLARLPKGKNKLVATYGGSANTLTKSLTFFIVQK